MGTADYEFTTVWRVAGTREEVVDILRDSRELPRWWPAVYLSVDPGRSGGADRVGASSLLHTKGFLPYTLRWELTLAEPVSPEGFGIRANGDLNGTGRWTLTQDGPETVVRFDWAVSAAKPILRWFSWALRPLFAANHRWAMARGQESLALELRRRRAAASSNAEALAAVPSPPGPTPPTGWNRRRRRATTRR